MLISPERKSGVRGEGGEKAVNPNQCKRAKDKERKKGSESRWHG